MTRSALVFVTADKRVSEHARRSHRIGAADGEDRWLRHDAPDRGRISYAVRGMLNVWAEHKVAPLWVDLRFCLDAKMVVDMHLGSGGAVARSPIQPAIEYTACSHSDIHAVWMLNKLDSETCSSICRNLSL